MRRKPLGQGRILHTCVALCLPAACQNLTEAAGWPGISRLPIEVAPAVGDFAGAVSLRPSVWLPVQGKPFIEMGGTVSAPDGSNAKQIPNFEFYVRADAIVVAPVSGMIWSVDHHAEFGDYGILIRRGYHTELWVEVDHVSNPMVKAGDHVTAGQTIGLAGKTRDPALGRVELQVSDGRDRPVTHYCPNIAFEPAANADIENRLTRLMQDIEARARNTGLYAEATMIRVGCIVEKLAER